MHHGRAEAQVADIPHVAADLVDVAGVGRRGVVAGAEHAVGGGQRDQRRGDRGAVVAADDQDGGEVVADVMGMGQRGAVGLGGMAAEAQRRPIVDGQEDAGRSATSWRIASCIGSIKADSSTRGSVQNRQSFWEKEAGFMPADRGPRARRGGGAGLAEPLDEDGISVPEGGLQPCWK